MSVYIAPTTDHNHTKGLPMSTDPNTQWCDAARASLAALRETHNVTARAEQ